MKFQCTKCAVEIPVWMARCPSCRKYNVIEEVEKDAEGNDTGFSKAAKIGEIETATRRRLSSGIASFDRLLGADAPGAVTGSSILIGGEPGIGKSTLLLQVLAGYEAQDTPTLYTSGEENIEQIAARGKRLDVPFVREIRVAYERTIEGIVKHVDEVKPSVLVVDSINTVSIPDAAQGGTLQIRQATLAFARLAADRNMVLFLVGHITKGGALAGPKVLEHLVDVTTIFELDEESGERTLRPFKNRHGTVDVIARFEMTGKGLVST